MQTDSFSILMVCLGNICRSPLAEGIFRHKAALAGLNCTVHSAGTGSWHIGNAPHPLSQKVALQHGIDISRQKARQFKDTDMDTYDYIYFMDSNNLQDAQKMAGKKWQPQKAALLLDALENSNVSDVPDPYFGGWDGYIEVYDLIDSACDAIIAKLKAL